MKKHSIGIICIVLILLSTTACKKASEEAIPAPIAKDVNLTLGNPSGAAKNIDTPNNYLLSKSQYTLSYNNNKGTPNWVSWRLSSNWLGNVNRQDDFRADSSLPSQWYHVSENDFSGSGFDRGHMCPSGDRTNTVSNNSATFLMTNMIPQAPNNNQITWQDLESYSRTLAGSGNVLFITAGPNGIGGSGSNGGTTYSLAGGKITVPASVWKLIVITPYGTSDPSQITTSTRVIAVNMPNTQSVSTHSWGYYRISVDQLESLTGYNFLSDVPQSVQDIIEATVDNGPTM